MPTWCNHDMVDSMCSFDFRVLCLARLGHWLGLLHVPLPFLALALSSISSSSCCRDAQLLGICQSEIWSHVFLESLTLEFVSIWAPLTFSIGKLQKLALSVCAWNFVSFFGIFCSNHSGTCRQVPWRKSVLCLASSSLDWALELRPTTAQALRVPRKTWAWTASCNKACKETGADMLSVAAAVSVGVYVDDRVTGILFITPVARQVWWRRRRVRRLALPTGQLAQRCSEHTLLWLKKALYVGRHGFNGALMPVSLQKLDIQCMHAWYKDKPFQKLEKTGTNKSGTHTTQIFFTPFRPKSLDCCAIYIALRLRRHGYQQVHDGRFGHDNGGLKEIWGWERCDAVVVMC